MRLFIFRHGDAEPAGVRGDFHRRLTEEGRRVLTTAAFGLARRDMRFDQLLHSPLVRAKETATVLEALSSSPPTSMTALAEPPDEALLAELSSLEGTVALVGHLPWVGELLAWLALGRASDSSAFLFSPGTVAVLEGTPKPSGMRITGLWRPEDLG